MGGRSERHIDIKVSGDGGWVPLNGASGAARRPPPRSRCNTRNADGITSKKNPLVLNEKFVLPQTNKNKGIFNTKLARGLKSSHAASQ